MAATLAGKIIGGSNGRIVLMAALLAVGLAGCGTKKSTLASPVFFPPDPNPPRVQYLKGVSGSRDVVQEKAGFKLLSLGEEETEVVKSIAKPYGLSSDKGKIYVVDTIKNDVFVMDLLKESFDTIPGNKGMGKLRKPINLAVASDGSLYVADTFRKEIVMYDASGNYIQGFGKEANMKPVDVAVDDNSIYALDIANNEIKVIDRKSGELLRSIGKSTETVQGLSMPTNLTMDKDGFLYVTNTGTGKVMKLDRDGHVISSFGKMGDAFAEFGRPRGIAVDHKGRIFVADASHQNVQIFNESGRLLMFFGDPGHVEGSLNLPAGVMTTTANLEYFQKFAAPDFILEEVIVVSNQFGPVKVSFYGLGQMRDFKGYPAPAPAPAAAKPQVEEAKPGTVPGGEKQ